MSHASIWKGAFAIILAMLSLVACSTTPSAPTPSPRSSADGVASPVGPTPQEDPGDLEAQAAIEKTMRAADSLFAKTGDYSKVTAASLAAAEPSLRYATPSRDAQDVSFEVSDSTKGRADGMIALTALSDSQTCFGVMLAPPASPSYAEATEMTSCHASDVRRWMDVPSV